MTKSTFPNTQEVNRSMLQFLNSSFHKTPKTNQNEANQNTKDPIKNPNYWINICISEQVRRAREGASERVSEAAFTLIIRLSIRGAENRWPFYRNDIKERLQRNIRTRAYPRVRVSNAWSHIDNNARGRTYALCVRARVRSDTTGRSAPRGGTRKSGFVVPRNRDCRSPRYHTFIT